jgi:hypothetical protein
MSNSIKSLAAILALCLAGIASGQSLKSYGGNGSGTTTTPAIDTTGATLLVATCFTSVSGAPTVSDNKGNTWHVLTQYGTGGSTGFVTTAYSYGTGSGPTVGTGHTFTCSNSIQIFSSAWTGTVTASDPLDGSTGAVVTSGTTGTPGSITPAATDLVISNWVSGDKQDVTPTASAPWAIAPQQGGGTYACANMGTSYDDICWAYRSAPGGSVTITWTEGSDTHKAMNLAAFKTLPVTQYPRAAADTVTAADSLAAGKVVHYSQALSDAATITPAATAAKVKSASISDTMSTNDTLALTVTINSIGESVTVNGHTNKAGDGKAANAAAAVALGDSIAATVRTVAQQRAVMIWVIPG